MRRHSLRTSGLLAAAIGLVALTATASPAVGAICPDVRASISCIDSSCCGGGGSGPGNADFGVVDRTGTYQVNDSLDATQLAALGVNTATVDSYANGAQPTWDAGVAYSGADQYADELASADTSALSSSSPVSTAKGSGTTAVAGSDSSASTTAAPPSPDGRYDVLWHWWDNQNSLVYYRRGYWNRATDSGFGDVKIRQKHNLDYRVAFVTTRYPEPHYPIWTGGRSYEYRTTVLHVKCSGWWIFRRCRVVERREVVAAVDYRELRDGGPFGVVTNYVEGYVYAPSWVKQAINI